MSHDMKTRGYTLKKRAESQEATRDRIVDAVVELHEELGPRNASISAIAERAGVRRMTVYRHFPDEAGMFEACTARWLEQHPPPDPGAWMDIKDGLKRCNAALLALYAYYRATQRMWEVSFRDEAEVTALQIPMRRFRDYLAAVAADILVAFGSSRSKALGATVAHCVEFRTWTSLAEKGLSDKAAAQLATTWARAAAKRQPV